MNLPPPPPSKPKFLLEYLHNNQIAPHLQMSVPHTTPFAAACDQSTTVNRSGELRHKIISHRISYSSAGTLTKYS